MDALFKADSNTSTNLFKQINFCVSEPNKENSNTSNLGSTLPADRDAVNPAPKPVKDSEHRGAEQRMDAEPEANGADADKDKGRVKDRSKDRVKGQENDKDSEEDDIEDADDGDEDFSLEKPRGTKLSKKGFSASSDDLLRFSVQAEKTEEYLQRLQSNPIFAVEDNDEEHPLASSMSQQAGGQLSSSVSSLTANQAKERKRRANNQKLKQTHDPNLIKCRNKLFGNLNAMELLQTIQEEPVAEEECLENKKINFGEKKQAQCKTLNSILQPLNKFRIERGLIDTPQKEPTTEKKSADADKMELQQDNRNTADSSDQTQVKQPPLLFAASTPVSFFDIPLSKVQQLPATLFPLSSSSTQNAKLQQNDYQAEQNHILMLSSEDTLNNLNHQVPEQGVVSKDAQSPAEGSRGTSKSEAAAGLEKEEVQAEASDGGKEAHGSAPVHEQLEEQL